MIVIFITFPPSCVLAYFWGIMGLRYCNNFINIRTEITNTNIYPLRCEAIHQNKGWYKCPGGRLLAKDCIISMNQPDVLIYNQGGIGGIQLNLVCQA